MRRTPNGPQALRAEGRGRYTGPTAEDAGTGMEQGGRAFAKGVVNRLPELCTGPYITGRLRRMGGSRDPRLNEPSNLVLLCGSGTSADDSQGKCHQIVESKRRVATADGWLVSQHADPPDVP